MSGQRLAYEPITAQYVAGPGSSVGSAILFWRRAGQCLLRPNAPF